MALLPHIKLCHQNLAFLTNFNFDDLARQDFEKSKEMIAMSCDCCDHNFLCRSCYNKNPSYDFWKPFFGNNHSVKDHISGESSLSKLLQAMINNKSVNSTDIGNITIISASQF